ncbi:3842_t:CDS:1, partial [Racocetra fulgida]
NLGPSLSLFIAFFAGSSLDKDSIDSFGKDADVARESDEDTDANVDEEDSSDADENVDEELDSSSEDTVKNMDKEVDSSDEDADDVFGEE